jgi:hypothetical protein
MAVRARILLLQLWRHPLTRRLRRSTTPERLGYACLFLACVAIGWALASMS